MNGMNIKNLLEDPNFEIGEVFDIDDILLFIKDNEAKIDFYKQLKKKRSQAIDEEVAKKEEQNELLRSKIVGFLAKQKIKNMNFPGVGKINTVDRESWEILDEEGLISHIKTLGKDKNILIQETKINKKELNKLLDDLDKNGNLGEKLVKKNSETSLTIQHDKKSDRSLDSDSVIEKENKSEQQTTFDFDKLGNF